MSIAKRVAEYQEPRLGARCRTCVLLKELPTEEAEALKVALEDSRISNAGLAAILKAEGYSIADSTVRRHRKGECQRDN